MASHADILDRPETLTVPFWVSLSLHILVIGGLSVGTFLENRNHLNMGSLTGGGLGSVMVNPVASIPLPNRGGRENPVANDTQSQIPTAPAPKEKAKPAHKEKAPSPNAIALKSDKAPKRSVEPAAQPNKFADRQKPVQSQIYSDVGQRMSSSTFAAQGGGGVRIGDTSPFGEQFGWYANLIRDNIAGKWKPSSLGLRSNPPPVVVRFTIRSDGSITNVKIGASSGVSSMDISAQRAVEDAQLPPLPPNFPRKQADVELKFELGN